MWSLQVASGVTTCGYSTTMGGPSATPSPAALPSPRVPPSHGCWCPCAAPLLPSCSTAMGTGHPPAPHACPHGCPLPTQPWGPKPSDLWGLFCPMSQGWAHPGAAAGQGVPVPQRPHSPLSPCRAREPFSGSAWPGAQPPAPTCPLRIPVLSATLPSTGKGLQGQDCPQDVPSILRGGQCHHHEWAQCPCGWSQCPRVWLSPWVAKGVPVAGQCQHGWPVVTPWIATVVVTLLPQHCVPSPASPLWVVYGEVVAVPACHRGLARRCPHGGRGFWGCLSLCSPQGPAAERGRGPSPREADGGVGHEHQRTVSPLRPGWGDTPALGSPSLVTRPPQAVRQPPGGGGAGRGERAAAAAGARAAAQLHVG